MKPVVRQIWRWFSRFARGTGVRASRAEPVRSKHEAPKGIFQAVRAGFPDRARERLQSVRDRYLSLRVNAVREALRQLRNSDLDAKQHAALYALLSETEAVAATEPLLRQADPRLLPLRAVSSFRQFLAIRTRQSQLSGTGPEWRINGKVPGYRFARELGLEHPEILQEAVPLAEIDGSSGIVIKPASSSGARGVYLVLTDGRVYGSRGAKRLSGWGSMMTAMRADLDEGRVRQDRWIVERLVTEDEESLVPGSDLKFYCFYGKVGLIVEIDRKAGRRYCEWDDAGNVLDTGRFEKNPFTGQGVSTRQVALVAQASEMIPAPFMRIDFLRSAHTESGISFCEFTPRPGAFDQFNQQTDRRLGDLFLDAEARLLNDLLQGKRFPRVFRGRSSNHKPVNGRSGESAQASSEEEAR